EVPHAPSNWIDAKDLFKWRFNVKYDSDKGCEWRDSRWHRTTIVAITLAAVLGGCSSDNTPKTTEETPTQVASELVTSVGTWDDWSGTVHVKAWVCDWSAPASHPHAT